jgi:hypothetical protein
MHVEEEIRKNFNQEGKRAHGILGVGGRIILNYSYRIMFGGAG